MNEQKQNIINAGERRFYKNYGMKKKHDVRKQKDVNLSGMDTSEVAIKKATGEINSFNNTKKELKKEGAFDNKS